MATLDPRPFDSRPLTMPPLMLWLIVVLACDAFVLSCLWQWFIVPPFGGRPLTVLEAAGVVVCVAFFRAPRDPKETATTWLLVPSYP